MTNFSHQLDRLKEVSGLQQDQEVAELLGISKAAMYDRKKRSSFPAEKLYALAAKRPELGIDVNYVLTGIDSDAQARLDAQSARIRRAADEGMGYKEIRELEGQHGERVKSVTLTADEQELLALFRAASLTGKAAAIGALQGAAGATAPKISIAGGVVSGQVADVIHNTHAPVARTRTRKV